MNPKLASLSAALFCLASSLLALPQGFHPVDGDVSPPVIDPNGWFIMESNGRAVVNWDSFSIANGEHVYFKQNGDGAALLSRVIGSDSSQILGHFLSNGSIYLINENGIFMGPSADIKTAGFVASAFDVNDQDFMNNGPLTFNGDSTQSVNNQGSIYCTPRGDIMLVARTAKNSGSMFTENGSISIISGEPQVTLYRFKGAKHLFVRSVATASSPEATTTAVEGNQVYLK